MTGVQPTGTEDSLPGSLDRATPHHRQVVGANIHTHYIRNQLVPPIRVDNPYGHDLTNSLMACGVAVSKPTTSSVRGSFGSAIEKGVAAVAMTTCLARMPLAFR